MKANIKLDLKNLTPVKLLSLLGHVTTNLDEHPEFTGPPYTIAELRTKVSVLSISISDATEGSRHSKLVRNVLVEDAKVTLRSLADYVRMVAKGDVVIMAKSGFVLAKQPSPVGYMGKPMMEPARITSTSGEVKLRWSAERGRRMYRLYMIDSDPELGEPTWTLVASTSNNTHIVQGLEPYKPYSFCVSAVGPMGEGFKSNPVLGRAA